MNICQIIGEIGEHAVHKYFKSTRSEDWYDPKKDGMIGDESYEVKTFRLNDFTNSFWVGQNKTNTMWDKVQNVDKLFFVKVPESENELATLYFCKEHKSCWFLTKTNKGLPIRAFPFTNCEEVCKLSKEHSLELLENSKTISTHKRFPTKRYA